MTTYAELLAGASRHLREGTDQLATDRFPSITEAYDAVGDFHGLLQAIASHTRRLLWPAKTLRPGMRRDVADLSPAEHAAAELAAAIDNLVGQARPHPSQLTPLTTPWRHAAMHLRAASDLVATHFQPDGSPRTPDAAATDARALDAGLVDLAYLAAAALAVEEPLSLRALQAGISRTVVTKFLPGLGSLTELALTAAGEGLDPGARRPLDALAPTSSAIRTDDPATELTDRMHRLRLTTWDLTATPADVLATLRDVTTIGIAVHAHAAAFHGAQPLTAPDPAEHGRGADALLLRGRAWQALHRDLACFATLAPPHRIVRDDLVALRSLLPELAPLTNRSNMAALADPVARRMGVALGGAIATMTEIADHSATAFARLARSRTLQLSARDLPRDLVTDAPDLVRARLANTMVAAPAAVTDAVLVRYDVVRAHPTHLARSAASRTMPPTHLEREVAVLARVGAQR